MSDKQPTESELWDAAKEKVKVLASVEVRDRAHTEKQVAEKSFWPGKINYADNRGHHPGATCIKLTSEESQNIDGVWTTGKNLAQVIDEYFQEHQGMLVLDVKTNAALTAAIIIHTRVTDKEDLDDFNEVNQIANELIQDLRKERERLKAEAEVARNKASIDAKEDAAKAMIELKRLAELGKSHERNCKKKK